MASLLYTLVVVHAHSTRFDAFMPPHWRNVDKPTNSGLAPRGLEEMELSWIAFVFQTIDLVFSPVEYRERASVEKTYALIDWVASDHD